MQQIRLNNAIPNLFGIYHTFQTINWSIWSYRNPCNFPKLPYIIQSNVFFQLQYKREIDKKEFCLILKITYHVHKFDHYHLISEDQALLLDSITCYNVGIFTIKHLQETAPPMLRIFNVSVVFMGLAVVISYRVSYLD